MSQIANGVSKRLVGLVMLDRNIARHGYDIYFKGEKSDMLQVAVFLQVQAKILHLGM